MNYHLLNFSYIIIFHSNSGKSCFPEPQFPYLQLEDFDLMGSEDPPKFWNLLIPVSSVFDHAVSPPRLWSTELLGPRPCPTKTSRTTKTTPWSTKSVPDRTQKHTTLCLFVPIKLQHFQEGGDLLRASLWLHSSQTYAAYRRGLIKVSQLV